MQICRLYKGACGIRGDLYIPDCFVIVGEFSLSMPFYVGIALKELAATAENRVIANVTQVVSQVIDAVQSGVAIPAGKGRNHFAGEWVRHARNGWLIQSK